jgi:hypothetical protein
MELFAQFDNVTGVKANHQGPEILHGRKPVYRGTARAVFPASILRCTRATAPVLRNLADFEKGDDSRVLTDRSRLIDLLESFRPHVCPNEAGQMSS